MASRFSVRAGQHPRRLAPITVPLPEVPAGDLAVRNSASGQIAAAQRCPEGIIFLLDQLDAGAEATFELQSGSAGGTGVQVAERRARAGDQR